MGGLMARRLIQAGYPLTICDTSEAALKPLAELGATVVDTPAAVASAAEIVLASLPTPPVVEAVALGANGVASGSKVKIFVDMSTTGATYAKRVAAGLAAKGIVAVDAPVSGGLAGAAKELWPSWSPAPTQRSPSSSRSWNIWESCSSWASFRARAKP